MAFEIARAGWLFRESSILRRWKKNWFVLYQDGVLKYFESPDSHVAEEVQIMPGKCIAIKTGSEIAEVTPPEGHGRSCLLSLMFTDNTGYKTWTLCAESPDDMSVWKMVLEEARQIRPTQNRTCYSAPPPPYSPGHRTVYYGPGTYPQQTVTYVYPNGQPVAGYHQTQTVQQGPNGQTIVYVRDRRGYDGMDLATGVVAGAALGSLMWWPLMF